MNSVHYNSGSIVALCKALLLTSLMTSTVHAERWSDSNDASIWALPSSPERYREKADNKQSITREYTTTEQDSGISRSPDKAELLRYLQEKQAKGRERLTMIAEEIKCVERTPAHDSSALWRCYEASQYKKQQLRQKYPSSQNPYRKRNQPRNGMMPNFNNMGMGRMPMPW